MNNETMTLREIEQEVSRLYEHGGQQSINLTLLRAVLALTAHVRRVEAAQAEGLQAAKAKFDEVADRLLELMDDMELLAERESNAKAA